MVSDPGALRARDEAPRLAALRLGSRSLLELALADDEALARVVAEDPLPDRDGYLALIRAAFGRGGMSELRREKRRLLAQVAARDLARELSLADATRALSDLADACLHVTLEHLEVADVLGVVGMGKLGGRELNYSSDIDVMFVADEVPRAAPAAEALLRELGGFAPEGQAFRIDANLRPEGRAGALVRSVDGYVEYYERWAKPWEYQALIKARACAGNQRLGRALIERTRGLVFTTDISRERVDSIRKMKERVETHLSTSTRRVRAAEGDDVKRGPGGIRDIEFSVQLLQLVHGGADPEVRSPTTLTALSSLVDGGYVAEDDGAGLALAYEWLRNVEHRLQLWQERQVHQLPRDPDALARIGRSMGFEDSAAAGAGERFFERHRGVLADVRGRFERLFYRPMIESLADPTGVRLPEDALKERLRVLGFRDVDRAARTLSGIVAGTSRRAKLLRVLSPPILRRLALTPLPDEGLFSFLTLGEALEGRLDALGALRDNPPGIEFLADVLGSGRVLGELLSQVPEELSLVADPRGPGGPKSRDRLVREASASLQWRDPATRLDGLRRFKRREFLRVALGDIAGSADPAATGEWLSSLAEACIEAALEDRVLPFAVVAMGKLGGRELSYASDLDVMFVHDSDQQEAERLAEELLQAVGAVTPEGQTFRIDVALRPEGKAGPLARSLQSYLEYYERWAKPWEHLALIKARPAAGELDLAEKLVVATRSHAYPDAVDDVAVAEIRHLKARMERERIPRGIDPRRHIKFGPGGAADIEFAIQLLQHRHGHSEAALQTPNTIEALGAARASGLIPEDDAIRLSETYLFLEKLRNRMFFIFGRPVDALPTKPEDLEALGVAMGFRDQPRQELEESYLRATRRARKIAEPLIYGSV